LAGRAWWRCGRRLCLSWWRRAGLKARRCWRGRQTRKRIRRPGSAVGCSGWSFGGQAAGGQVPELLVALVASPDDAGVQDALGDGVAAALHDDPQLQAAVVEMLTGFYRREIEAGSTPGYGPAGNLLQALDDLDGARAAYQQAIDCGHVHAMLSLAHLLMAEVGDAEGARVWPRRAIGSADAEVAAEAMVDLGHLLMLFQRDADGARAAFQQAIDLGHPGWAPAAMAGLGHLLRKQGDSAGARAAFQRAVDSGHADWAAPALMELLNLLRERDDVDGARAVYRKAVETGNPDASYGLVVIGQLLDQQGDAEGARAAFQEAADAGDELAQHEVTAWSRKDLPERTTDWDDGELADLPPGLNPRRMAATGAAVLERGLPALPEVLTHQMAVPIAYWKAERCAVVLFLRFHRDAEGRWDPMALMATYSRDEDQWTPHRRWMGTGLSPDPIARPGDLRHLGAQAITISGHSWPAQPAPGNPAMIVHGQVGPAVTQLALIQDGCEDRRPLESHFGAWLVCTEQASPFQVTALDASGTALASIDESFPPE
jgi:tetratricopeptide (TPR) repeat protein